jgi:hypothetical protein
MGEGAFWGTALAHFINGFWEGSDHKEGQPMSDDQTKDENA